MPAPIAEAVVLGAFNPAEGKAVSVPSHQAINEKIHLTVDDAEISKDGALDTKTNAAPPPYDSDDHSEDNGSEDVIIITGADAAAYLLPLRDDGELALTFRSLFLATCLSAFQAVMSQIYTVS
jgi:hypothetical protein